MSYLALGEAAAYVKNRSGHEIEPTALLRAGVHGALLVAAAFSGLMRNTSKHQNEDVVGLLLIPPRHLLEIEIEGQAKILGAMSLDGANMYSPQVIRSFSQLVVFVSELERVMPLLFTHARQETPAPEVEVPSMPSKSWKQQAELAAFAYIARHKAQNLFPSQKDVAQAVEGTLRAGGVKGDNGKPVSAAYVEREVLRGAWWRANKP